MRPTSSRYASATFVPLIWLFAGVAAAAPFDVGSTTTGGYKTETTLEFTDTTNRTTWVAPKLGITIPLGSSVEIEFSANYRFVDRNGTMESGFGDAAIKGKWAVLAESKDSWVPGLAFEPKLTLPTGDKGRGLGTGDTHLDVPLLMSKSFGSYGLGVKLAYDFNLDGGADNVLWGVLGTVKLTDSFLLGVEVIGDSPSTRLDKERLRTNIGFKWKLAGTVTLDGLVGRTVRTPLADETTTGKIVVEVKF